MGGSWFIGILLVALIAPGTLGLTPLLYMANYCHAGRVHVNDSLLLELTHAYQEDRFSSAYLHCSVEVTVAPGSAVYVHFLSLDISDHANTPDRLHIYDFNDYGIPVRVTPPTGLYGALGDALYDLNTAGIRVKDYKSSASRLRLDYLGKPTKTYRGFKVLLTAYKREGLRSSCQDGYFHCPVAHLCVPSSLVCDSQPNCGQVDPSDEKRCVAHAQTVTSLEESYSVVNAVLVGLVACVVFLVSIGLIGLFVFRYNKKQQQQGQGPGLRVLASRTAYGVCTITSDLDSFRLYAPPSYEDVMGQVQAEPPPEYDSVTAPHPRTARPLPRRLALGDSGSESEDSSSECGSPYLPPSQRRCHSLRHVVRGTLHAPSPPAHLDHLRASPSDPSFQSCYGDDDAVHGGVAGGAATPRFKGKGKAGLRGKAKSSSLGGSPNRAAASPPSEGISSLPAPAQASSTSQESGVVADMADSNTDVTTSGASSHAQSSPGSASRASRDDDVTSSSSGAPGGVSEGCRDGSAISADVTSPESSAAILKVVSKEEGTKTKPDSEAERDHLKPVC